MRIAIFYLLILTVFSLWGQAASAQGFRQMRTITANRTATPPVIDGDIFDECWKSAERADSFMLITGKAAATEQTEAWVLHDGSNLYLAFKCRESRMSSIIAERTVRNSNVWQDDCVEVFIDATHGHAKLDHFAVNPVSAQFDGLGRAANWIAKSRRYKDFWTCEIAIPYTDLGAADPVPGSVWGINFCREERPSNELTAWSCPEGISFSVPDRAGDLIFGPLPFSLNTVCPSSQSSSDIEKRTFSMEISNPGNESGSYIAELTVLAKGNLDSSLKEFKLAPGSRQTVKIPYQLKQRGDSRLLLAITDVASGRKYAFTYNLQVLSQALNSSVWPQEKYDNTLHIAKNTAQLLHMVFANHSGKAKKFKLILDMPQEFAVLDTSRPYRQYSPSMYQPVTLSAMDINRDGMPFRRHVFSFDKPLSAVRIEDVKAYASLYPIMVKVKDASYGKCNIYYHIEGESGPDGDEEHMLKAQILPEPSGKTPKSIKTAIFSWYITSMEDRNQDEMLDTWKKAGIKGVYAGSCGDEAPKLNEKIYARGMEVTESLWWFWWGKDWLKAHPEDQAVGFDLKPMKPSGVPSINPIVLLENDEAFDSALGNRIKNSPTLGRHPGHKGYFWDLEGPAAFSGSFDNRNIEAFHVFAGIPSTVQLSPEKIKKDYRLKWVEYATRQSSDMAAKVRRAMKKVAPAAGLYMYGTVQSQTNMEDYRIDWNTMASNVDQAQICWYNQSPGGLDATKSELGAMKELVNRHSPSTQFGVWLRTGSFRGVEEFYPDPRVFKPFLLECSAVGAREMALWWDDPMDGRFLGYIADANTIISNLEEYFVKGTRHDSLAEVNPKSGMSYYVLDRGASRVILISNHDPREARKFEVRNTGQGSSKESCWSYTERKWLAPAVQEVAIGPLDVYIMILGDRKNTERIVSQLQ